MASETLAKLESMNTDTMTVARFVLEEQKANPHATGSFTILLQSILTAIKAVSQAVRRAGFAQLHGKVGVTNVQGEEVAKLDVLANDMFVNMLKSSFEVGLMISEEDESVIEVDLKHQGRYIVCFDPLDGSSNIDCLVSIGSIFSIFKRETADPVNQNEVLKPGSTMIAAGYALYGNATMVVLTSGNGVNGFTLDPSIGEFILTNPNIQIKPKGKIFSINEGYAAFWEESVTKYIHKCKFPESGSPMNARYVGSMVADVHRTLVYGGIFLYPANKKSPKGKLRYLYEAAPMAFIIEQAGGKATTGKKRILDVVPENIHDRVPVVLGSTQDVDEYLSFCV
ncbi:Fructose-1,6-bisphosphatase 1-like [Oopsacas minuta]|uniref:Fructose-1,6-bisphosphatase isozyme 2 n=1 Tax=Oopsacas minuta TaxID=111878 RepID=A0AAV7JN44_9METZ|nr:Fructose-1,6-bisphosphatase 1-like [Oopsacas minuta]